MSTWVWIVIAIAVVIVVLAIVWSAIRAKRTRALQGAFGQEYDRTVDQAGARRTGERDRRAGEHEQQRHDHSKCMSRASSSGQSRGFPAADAMTVAGIRKGRVLLLANCAELARTACVKHAAGRR